MSHNNICSNQRAPKVECFTTRKITKEILESLTATASQLPKYRKEGSAINHVKKLKEAYLKEGRLGVLKYIRPYIKDFQRQVELNQEIQKLSA